nr:winged helix-turn-helix domain-containing protein [Hasllibacter sp. MH4015]
MLVTVEALKDLGGSATIQELDEKVIELEGVTEAEQAFTMPRDENRTRVNYYLAWARTYLKRGDALNNSKRGVWALTETGSAISDLNATQAIYDLVTQEERQRARLKRLAAKKADADKGEEIEVMADDGPADEEDWKSALLAVLGKMTPDGFERLAQRLLREAGFTKVEVRGKSGDGGIDGVGFCASTSCRSRSTFNASVGREASVQKKSVTSEGPCRAAQTKGCSSPRAFYQPSFGRSHARRRDCD